MFSTLTFLLTLITLNNAFKNSFYNKRITKISSSTWQEDLDQILDVDTPCDSRRDMTRNFIKRASEISTDLVEAVQNKDIEKLAPKKLSYGKAIFGLQAFRKQLVSDIIPELLTKTVPKLIDEAPKIINSLVEKGPTAVSEDLLKRGKEVVSTVREISQDPSMLQSTVDELRREVKNIVKSTPIGIDEPAYTVELTTDSYEIRRYSPYSVCSTAIDSEVSDTNMDLLSTGRSFNTLASYIFGENSKKEETAVDSSDQDTVITKISNGEKLTMTTPVIIGSGAMSFVLPKYVNVESAPVPNSDKVFLRDMPSELIAVRTFTGIATEGEVNRQKALLEDSLLIDNIVYDNLSFRVYQYNPPYTVPWVRRNEVAFSVSMPLIPKDDFESEDASKFMSAPEAGD